jgi:ferredoxin-NADP reductase/ferredoxin
MANVIYGGQSYDCGTASVLDCLTAQGAAIPSSCRSGVCQTCLMQVTEGRVPEKAQAGIKPTLAAQGYFLACSCYPEDDIAVTLPEKGMGKITATVSHIELLNADILGIKIKPTGSFEYKAGQFINLYKDEATARSYSLASVPSLDDELYLNVRKVPGGLVSKWVFENLKAGDSITISEAAGDCFYIPGNAEQNILLIGTGSGLAPLYGIIRDALLNGHTGQIKLYHGSYNTTGLYLVTELRKLAQLHANFSYIPCLSEQAASDGYAQGMVLDVALRDNPNLSGWRVFLCGNPDMVNAAKREAYLSGAAINDIYADPFLTAIPNNA